MAYEILKKIVAAEDEAESIVADANKQHEEIIKNAEKKAEEIILLTNQKNDEYLNQASKAAYESVQAETDLISKEARKDCVSIRTKAEANKEAAINAVIGKVVGNYGCS